MSNNNNSPFFDFMATCGDEVTTKNGNVYVRFYTFESKYILIKREYARCSDHSACVEGKRYLIRVSPAIYGSEPFFRFSVLFEL